MLLTLAGLFAVVALLLALAWPVLVVPPGQRVAALRTPAARSIAGGAATLAISAILTPMVVAALISGADTVQFVASEFGNLSFGM